MKVQNVNFAGATAGTKIREAFANAETEMNSTNPLKRTRPSIEETKKSTQERQLDEISFHLCYIGNQMKALVDLQSGKSPEKRVKGLDRV